MRLNKSTYWSEKYEKKDGSSFVSPKTSGGKFLSVLGIEKENGIYKDFNEKNITDIGSGFGGFIFEIENSCNSINAVDPLYASDHREEMLIRDIKRAKYKVKEGILFLDNYEKKTKNIANQINELFYLAPTHRNMDEISCLEKQQYKTDSVIKNIKKGILGKQEVFNELEIWKKRGFDNSDKIKLIGESGENTGIDSNSQDYVFIKHLINKKSVDPNGLLDEALRITKSGGKIFIIDDIITNKDKLISILKDLDYTYNTKEGLSLIEITK